MIPLMVAGGVISAGGQLIGAYGNWRAGKQQKQQAYDNADELERNAEEARIVGENQSQQMEIKAESVIADQQAGFAAGGLDVRGGSAGKIAGETELAALETARRIRLEAAQEAAGLRRQAFYSRKAGNNAEKQGKINAFGQLLGAGGSVLGRFG